MAMTAPATKALITGEELLEMGDIGPCELIDGRIIPMSPTGSQHGIIEAILTAKLYMFVSSKKIGWVVNGETGVYTRRNPDSIRGVDVAFVSRERQPERPTHFLQSAPELIIEIVSPSDRWQDLRTKIEEYLAIGVDRVWIVEPDRKTVLVYRTPTEMSAFGPGETVKGEGALDGFSVAVSELFDE